MYKQNLVSRFTLCVAVYTLFLISCTKNFSTLNTPKNQISESGIDATKIGLFFANAEYQGLQGSFDAWELMHELHSDIYAQIYTTTSSGFHTDNFQENVAWVTSGWDAFYSGPAVSLNYVQNYAKDNDLKVEKAVADIWSVPMYERMTDFFGPVIYTQFGNGQTSVAYDSQDSIYYHFFAVLDTATEVLKANLDSTAFASDDIIYSGNVSKWLKFANSLRLRLAMRISYVDPDRAKAEAEKAVQDGVMQSTDDNAMMSTTVNSLNLEVGHTYINPFCMSATSESILLGFQDPRLTVFFNQGGSRTGGTMGYHGLRNGLTTAEKTADVRSGASGNSFVASAYLPIADGGTNPPFPIMSLAEVDFLKAEGALRGWNMGGDTKTFYDEGIRASLQSWTDLSDDSITNYINSLNKPSKPVNLVYAFNSPAESDITVAYNSNGTFEEQLEQIITQKWIDMHFNGWECWAERRRTGYPRGYAIISSLNPDMATTDLVRRVQYPTDEYDDNAAAVKKAVSLLGGDDNTTTRLWWDKKDLALYPDLSKTVVNVDTVKTIN